MLSELVHEKNLLPVTVRQKEEKEKKKVMSFPRGPCSDSRCVVSVLFSDTLWMHVLLMSIFFLGTSTVF